MEERCRYGFDLSRDERAEACRRVDYWAEITVKWLQAAQSAREYARVLERDRAAGK